MTETMAQANASDVAPTDYVVVGVATCFIRTDGDVEPIQILEPIPSAALETLLRGTPTSYESILVTTLGDIWDGTQPKRLAQVADTVQFCEDFGARAIAATRTYKTHPAAQTHIPAGTPLRELNYSLERKRLLNADRFVKVEDNVKQHAHTHQVL